MSMTPTTPNLGQAVKSFWERPEGTTGKYILAVLGIGAAGVLFFFWGIILPFVLATIQNTVMLLAWIGGLIALYFVATSWRTRMVFQLFARWITSFWMTLDPIGILKNMIVQLKQRLEIIVKHVSTLAGVRRQLGDNIDENTRNIEKAKNEIKAADAMLAKTNDANQRLQIQFERQERIDQVADLGRDNKELISLLQLVDKLYNTLERMRMATSYYIKQRENKVKNAERKYKAVNSAFKAMTAAKGAFSGSSSEQAFYEETFQYLADDASMKLGAIDDFAQLTEQFLTSVDLTRGAANFEVLNQLEQASMRLLPASSMEPGLIETNPNAARALEPVPVSSKTAGGDYDKVFGQ